MGGMQSWGHQGDCTTTTWGTQRMAWGSHTQLSPTGGTENGWLCERQQHRHSQLVKALPGLCTAARVGKANLSLLPVPPAGNVLLHSWPQHWGAVCVLHLTQNWCPSAEQPRHWLTRLQCCPSCPRAGLPCKSSPAHPGRCPQAG